MKYSFDLRGKRAVVTGGAGDIGFAIAQTLYEHGATVSVIDLKRKMPEKMKEDSSFFCVEADLSVRENCRQAYRQAKDQMSGIDILVNAAGIIRRENAENFSEKDWDEVIDLNLNTTFLFCQMAGRDMLEQRSGRIINIASMNAFDGGKRVCSYSASKGAVALLTKALCNEWSGKGVNVNAIAPGYIKTQINTYYRTPAGAEAEHMINSRIAMGRWGNPEDLSGPALFLASDAADYISGIILPVDGGYQAN